MAYRAEYIWIDGKEPTAEVRSKTRILEDGAEPGIWGFDGSSTNQATGDNSDVVLDPVFQCPDPIRGGENILVLCETLLTEDMSPHPTNTRAAAPHLPCPDLDAAMIMKMCRFAIDNNFGWPRKIPPRPEFDLQEQLAGLTGTPPAATNGKPSVQLGLQVNGRGGGQFELTLRDGRIQAAKPGVSPKCTASYYLNTDTFQEASKIIEEAITQRIAGPLEPSPFAAAPYEDVPFEDAPYEADWTQVEVEPEMEPG